MKAAFSVARATTAALFLGAASAMAAPTVYIALGSGNQVIAVDAASGRITKS